MFSDMILIRVIDRSQNSGFIKISMPQKYLGSSEGVIHAATYQKSVGTHNKTKTKEAQPKFR